MNKKEKRIKAFIENQERKGIPIEFLVQKAYKQDIPWNYSIDLYDVVNYLKRQES